MQITTLEPLKSEKTLWIFICLHNSMLMNEVFHLVYLCVCVCAKNWSSPSSGKNRRNFKYMFLLPSTWAEGLKPQTKKQKCGEILWQQNLKTAIPLTSTSAAICPSNNRASLQSGEYGRKLWTCLCQYNLTAYPTNWFCWHSDTCRLLCTSGFFCVCRTVERYVPERLHQSAEGDEGPP